MSEKDGSNMLDILFNGTLKKSDKWVASFARYFGIYYEWLLAPWFVTKGKILVGPGMKDKEDKEGIEPEPKRPKVTVDEWNFFYDWLVAEKGGKVVLVESKSWIAYAGFNPMFENNKYEERFMEKYEIAREKRKRNDETGLYYFVCHSDSRDFKVISTKRPGARGDEAREWEVAKRWLLWWDTEGGTEGRVCEQNKELTVFSIKEILRSTWNGDQAEGFAEKLYEMLDANYVKPLEAALDVIKLGVSRALEEESAE